jgi:hypothetical protein
MKKIVISMTIIAVLVLFLVSCGNKTMFDTTYSFEEVIAVLPNGEIIEGELDSWTDYEDGDQLQIKVDGITYLVHSTNCVLISK